MGTHWVCVNYIKIPGEFLWCHFWFYLYTIAFLKLDYYNFYPFSIFNTLKTQLLMNSYTNWHYIHSLLFLW